MGAPKLKNISESKQCDSSEDKEKIKSYQNRLSELLKDKKMAKKAAQIIEQMLSEDK